MKCPRCQQENPPQAKFCLECGAQFTHPDQGVPPAASVTDLQRALSEALDQHAAMSEILGVISRSPADAAPVFEVIAKNACRLCDAVIANAIRFDGELMHNVAQQGFTPEAQEVMRRLFPMKPTRSSMAGRAILKGAVVYTEDASADQELLASRQFARELGFRAQVSVPMLRDGVPVGAITVARRSTGLFPERQISLLRAFADQAVIALENVRLFTELQDKNRALTEALDQQTATSEMLRVISGSPTDIQPVFEAIIRSAVALCGGIRGVALRLEAGQLHRSAYFNMSAGTVERLEEAYPREPTRDFPAGRAVVDGAPAHVFTEDAVAREFPGMVSRAGVGSILAVPLLREGEPIGALSITRTHEVAFTDRQIALLQTFADQAVITIENVRLFTELQEKNGALTEALEQQTATPDLS